MIKGDINTNKITLWQWSVIGLRKLEEDEIKKLNGEIEDDYVDEEEEEQEMMNMNPLNAPNIEVPDDKIREIEPKKVVYYCPQYDDIKSNPNKIWNYYDIRIQKTLKVMSYWKSFSMEDLYQQAYIHFVELCEIYLPFYNNKFYPFDRYVFKNIIIKLRAYIQNYYLKSKREQPTEISERTNGMVLDDIKDADNRLLKQQLFADLSDRQIDILELTYQGYKQQEVGEILDISQSRVSVIKKKTIKTLQEQFVDPNEDDNIK